uniref:Bestrophin homolog n=1 Tax=Strongyloides stercoralis TaxID=6248 RepID=A0A0K0DUX6_STRER
MKFALINVIVIIIFVSTLSNGFFINKKGDKDLTDQCPPGLKRCINIFTVLRNPSILPSWKPSYWTTAYNQYRAMRELFNNDEVAQIVPINHDLSVV